MTNGQVLDIEPMSIAYKGCLLKKPLKKTNSATYDNRKSNQICLQI